MSRVKKIRVLLLVLAVSTSIGAGAQSKNELGLQLGGEVSPDRAATGANIAVGTSLTYQATYARKLSNGNTALYLEFPFVATPSRDVQSRIAIVPRNYASLFVTPAVRVMFATEGAISPWLSLGGGYGRYDESSTLLNGSANTRARGTNTGAAQFGAGVDLRTPVRLHFPIGVRAEVRDFYAGAPRLNVATDKNRQHNVIVSGGIVVHF